MEPPHSPQNGLLPDHSDDTSKSSSGSLVIPPPLTPRARPTFATPLLQSTRSQTLQWTLPRPFHQHKLIGRSRAAWHTSFLVPSLNTVLDAGVIIDDSRPQNVFITHGHSDHSYNVLTYCRRNAPPDIYVPAPTAKFLDDYVISSKSLNLGFNVRSNHTFNTTGDLVKTRIEKTIGKSRPVPASKLVEKDALLDTASEDDDEDPNDTMLPTHFIVPVDPLSQVTYPLKTLPSVSVSILPRAHTVPSVGFLFTQTSNRLKPEYRSLAGQQLKELRQKGVDITYTHRSPMFAFLGDGDHTSLLDDPVWLIGNEDAGVSHCPVVITECSFLDESHRAQAVKTKHTLWADLEPIIRRHQRTTWILMHFSKRYSDSTIVKFFEELEDCPQNIVVWVDGGNEMVGEDIGKKAKKKATT